MTALLFLCLLSAHLVASEGTTSFQCQQSPKGTLENCTSDLDACMVTKDDSTMLGTRFSTTSYECGKIGNCAIAFSLTIGEGKNLTHSSACCAESGCNKDLVWNDLPAPGIKNGFVCPKGCYVQTEDQCTSDPVSCTDAQDSCITATGSSGAKTFILKGCGTSNMCNVTNFELEIGGIPYHMETITCEDPEPPAANP